MDSRPGFHSNAKSSKMEGRRKQEKMKTSQSGNISIGGGNSTIFWNF